jgi:hypothetical protein
MLFFFIHIITFSNRIKPQHDRAQRNMAHSDSARRFSHIVPGPLSSQSVPAQPNRFARPKCFPSQTPDSRIQELSSLHKSASIHRHSEFLYHRADAVLSQLRSTASFLVPIPRCSLTRTSSVCPRMICGGRRALILRVVGWSLPSHRS